MTNNRCRDCYYIIQVSENQDDQPISVCVQKAWVNQAAKKITMSITELDSTCPDFHLRGSPLARNASRGDSNA